MNFNIIGAGRLGKSLALALNSSGQARLTAICNANFLNAELFVREVGTGLAVANLADLPSADLTFITTPDDLIPSLARQLAKQKNLKPQSIVVHCSGALSTTALEPLKADGYQLATIHPLRAFKKGAFDHSIFQDCDCVVEGDDKAVAVISTLFKKLGARIISINQENKIAYHAAAVLASNYLVTLAASAIQLFNKAGIPADLAKQITTNLMTSSLTNIKQSENAAAALTGPLQRGDLNTISKHLEVLPTSLKRLYTSAGLATLPLTNLSSELKIQIEALMRNTSKE